LGGFQWNSKKNNGNKAVQFNLFGAVWNVGRSARKIVIKEGGGGGGLMERRGDTLHKEDMSNNIKCQLVEKHRDTESREGWLYYQLIMFPSWNGCLLE
jgi:hypothetical protein